MHSFDTKGKYVCELYLYSAEKEQLKVDTSIHNIFLSTFSRNATNTIGLVKPPLPPPPALKIEAFNTLRFEMDNMNASSLMTAGEEER